MFIIYDEYMEVNVFSLYENRPCEYKIAPLDRINLDSKNVDGTNLEF